MRKEFNNTGSCNPEWHYMVDSARLFRMVVNLIKKGKYFTTNRPRQYGKTTTLMMIWRRMSVYYSFSNSMGPIHDTESKPSHCSIHIRHIESVRSKRSIQI